VVIGRRDVDEVLRLRRRACGCATTSSRSLSSCQRDERARFTPTAASTTRVRADASGRQASQRRTASPTRESTALFDGVVGTDDPAIVARSDANAA